MIHSTMERWGSSQEAELGHFIELLNFRLQGGHTALADHLRNCPKNASYISKTTQNELINCCGEIITEQIIAGVKDIVFCSSLVDESSDLSNKDV